MLMEGSFKVCKDRFQLRASRQEALIAQSRIRSSKRLHMGPAKAILCADGQAFRYREPSRPAAAVMQMALPERGAPIRGLCLRSRQLYEE
jgi:hypothetical protein